MRVGWIRLHRKIEENWVYQDSDYLKIWVTMLMRASHKEHTQIVGNTLVKLERGDFVFGRLKWAEELNIKDWKIQTATALMVKDSMITKKISAPKFSTYHIENYHLYNQQSQQQEDEEECGVDGNSSTANPQQSQQQGNSITSARQQQGNTNNKGNKENKDKKINIVEINSFFESIWTLYPNKVGKGAVKEPQRRKLYDIGFDEVSRCIERYRASKEDWRKWKDGSTFFNSGYVDYLDKNYQATAPEEEGHQLPDMRDIDYEDQA